VPGLFDEQLQDEGPGQYGSREDTLQGGEHHFKSPACASPDGT
jgi:hypothetical protein